MLDVRKIDPERTSLRGAEVEAFRRNGHLQIRGFFDAAAIARLDEAIAAARKSTERLAGDADGQLERDAFLWRRSDAVAAFSLDSRLGRVAAQLIGARGIRLIHDVALDKAREHGPTPWHRDSDFWSFAGAGALTMWIPLEEVRLDMGPLRYATGSHLERDLRPLRRLEKPFIPARFRIASSPLDVGDVAVHHYETLHGAARNRGPRTRRAFAIHFIDADATYRDSAADGHVEHARRCGWQHLEDGAAFTDGIAPLVYRDAS